MRMGVLQHLSCSTIISLPPSQLGPRSHFRRRFFPCTAASRESSPPQRIASSITRRQLIGGIYAAAAVSLPPLHGTASALSLSDWESVRIDPSLENHGGGGGGSRRSGKQERPRFFDSKARRICWDKARKIPGRDPERWRIDAAGNIVCRNLHTCNGCLCYEYDHIIPFSKGGESVEENCQILQTRVNRLKSNKDNIGQQMLKGYSCDIKLSDDQLDIIEMAVYGSVSRPGNHCIVGSVVGSFFGKHNSKDHNTCNLHKND